MNATENRVIVYYADVKDDSFYNVYDKKNACLMANGILRNINAGGYSKGNRNNIAVDLACCCHVIGIDPRELASELSEDLDSLFELDDENDICSRFDVLDGYLDYWDTEPGKVFGKMFETETWKTMPETPCSPVVVCMPN